MKLLIRATNWVGDAILALPALRLVRERFPDAQISILARPYVSDLYRGQEICDELIVYASSGRNAASRALAADLRQRQFDVALLLQNAFGAAWLAWRAGIPQRLGYARDGRSVLLTRAIPVPRPGEVPGHEKFYYLELLRRLGWIDRFPDDQDIALRIDNAHRQRAETMLREAGSRNAFRVAVGAGASYGSAKCWAPERFANTVNRLRTEQDLDVILFGTAGETAVSEAIAARLSHPAINLTGKTEIADLPALLSQCHLFIGNDSGAMHVAGAAGLPVVAVFGPTDPYGTAPVTSRCRIVQQKPYCSPCFLRRCPIDHRCMNAVTPEMVVRAARPWLPEEGQRA